MKEGAGGGESFLPHPFPALLFPSFFAWSLTLVPHSLLQNRMETLATQAIPCHLLVFTVEPSKLKYGRDLFVTVTL